MCSPIDDVDIMFGFEAAHRPTRVAEFLVRKPFTHRSSGGTLRPYRLVCRILLGPGRPTCLNEQQEEEQTHRV
jgi:hypothetical protein